MPNYVWVRNDRGSEYAVVESAFNSEIHERVDGEVVEDAYGRPVLKQTTEAATPNHSDTKTAWVDFATTQGADPAEAEAMTKADLINQYDKEQ